MEQKKAYLFYQSWADQFKWLNNEQKLIIREAIDNYAFYSEKPNFQDNILNMAWERIKYDIDLAQNKRADCERKQAELAKRVNELLKAGKTQKQVAAELDISQSTVSRLRNIQNIQEYSEYSHNVNVNVNMNENMNKNNENENTHTVMNATVAMKAEQAANDFLDLMKNTLKTFNATLENHQVECCRKQVKKIVEAHPNINIKKFASSILAFLEQQYEYSGIANSLEDKKRYFIAVITGKTKKGGCSLFESQAADFCNNGISDCYYEDLAIKHCNGNDDIIF